MYNKCNDMHDSAFCAGRLVQGLRRRYTFVYPLLDGRENGCNYAFMGATADQMSEWGYDATEVPNVDDKASTSVGRRPAMSASNAGPSWTSR